MRLHLDYLYFMLELYSKVIYLIGTNTTDTRRISRKIVKEKFIIREIYLGGGQFFIKNFKITYKPNYIGEN